MKKILFILLGLLVFIDSHGQKDTLNKSKVCIKFAPLALFPPYTGPSIRLGADYRSQETIGHYFELGYYPNFYGIYEVKGILLKYELKFYMNKYIYTAGPHTACPYFSAELFAKHQSYNTEDTINMAPAYSKFYSVRSDVGCITIKYGEQNVYRNGIVVDLFVGLGVRFKNTTSSLAPEENEHIQSSSDYGPNVFAHTAGEFVYPNISCGFNIGYRIK